MIKSKIKSIYFPELLALFFGRDKPSMVSVNMTDKCNQNCIYCEIGKNNAPLGQSLLTKKELFWIIDQMHEYKLKRLSMCGGEPFLFADIIDVVAYAWEKNIRCNITSNGMLIQKLEHSELKSLEKFKTAINISIDSFDDTIQSTTRGHKLALSNALQSIEILKQYKISVTVLSAISKYNYKNLYDSFISAYDLGVKQILYQPIIYYSNYPDQPVLNEKSQLNVSIKNIDELMDQLMKIYHFEKRHKISTNLYRIFPWIKQYLKVAHNSNGNWFFHDVLKKFYCREVFAVIDISYYGGIQPCGLSLAEINIKEDSGADLLSLWSEATHKLKSNLRENKYPVYCNGCCHKFSRNMLASVIKYPVANKKALMYILSLIIKRIMSGVFKKFYL